MIRVRLIAWLAGLAMCGLAGAALAQQAAPTTDQKIAPAAKPKAKPKPAAVAPKPAAARRPVVPAKPVAASKPAARPAPKPVARKPAAPAKPVAAAKKPAPAVKPAAPAAVTRTPPKPPAAAAAAAAAAVTKPEPAAPKPAPPVSATTASLGSAPSRLGQYGDWNAYAANPNGRKVCFALAQPASTQSDPPNRPRDGAYVFVSSRPGEKVANEVSIVIGYAFKPSSEASVEIGPAKFAMYTQNDGAWIKNPAEESRLVESMRKGSDMLVKGTSGRGTQTTDTVSLKGLAQALDRISQECR